MSLLKEDTARSWRQLYAAASLAGAVSGILVALGALPAIPEQVTAWIHSFDSTWVAVLVSLTAGALLGLALAAIAQLGVNWQLRRRSKL
jgi:hypothetical protein